MLQVHYFVGSVVVQAELLNESILPVTESFQELGGAMCLVKWYALVVRENVKATPNLNLHLYERKVG